MTLLAFLAMIGMLCMTAIAQSIAMIDVKNLTSVEYDAEIESFIHQAVSVGSRIHSFSETALEVLDKYKTATSCHKTAVVALLDGCASLKDLTDSKHPENLQKLMNSHQDSKLVLFRINVAFCEHAPAGLDILPECKPLVQQQPPAPRSRSAFDWLTRRNRSPSESESSPDDPQVKSCLQAMQNSGVYWISYSNAGQDARAICESVRPNIEYDNFIASLSSLTEVVLQSTTSLKDHGQSVLHLLQHELESRRRLEQTLQSFATDLDLKLQNTSTAVDLLATQIATMNGPADKMSAFFKNHMADLEHIEKVTSSTHAHAQYLKTTSSDLLREITSVEAGMKDLAKTQGQIGAVATNTLKKIAMLKESVQGLPEYFQKLAEGLKTLDHKVGGLTNEIDTAKGQMTSLQTDLASAGPLIKNVFSLFSLFNSPWFLLSLLLILLASTGLLKPLFHALGDLGHCMSAAVQLLLETFGWVGKKDLQLHPTPIQMLLYEDFGSDDDDEDDSDYTESDGSDTEVDEN